MSNSCETIWSKIQLIEEIIYKCSLTSTGDIEEQTSFMRQIENEYAEQLIRKIIKDTDSVLILSDIRVVNELNWDNKRNNSFRTINCLKFKISTDNENPKFEIDCILKTRRKNHEHEKRPY